MLHAKVGALAVAEASGGEAAEAARRAEVAISAQLLEAQAVLKARNEELLAAQAESRRHAAAAELARQEKDVLAEAQARRAHAVCRGLQGLQPHRMQPATPCSRGCSPMRQSRSRARPAPRAPPAAPRAQPAALTSQVRLARELEGSQESKVELRHLLESLQQMQAGWQQAEAASRAQLLGDKEAADREWIETKAVLARERERGAEARREADQAAAAARQQLQAAQTETAAALEKVAFPPASVPPWWLCCLCSGVHACYP